MRWRGTRRHCGFWNSTVASAAWFVISPPPPPHSLPPWTEMMERGRKNECQRSPLIRRVGKQATEKMQSCYVIISGRMCSDKDPNYELRTMTRAPSTFGCLKHVKRKNMLFIINSMHGLAYFLKVTFLFLRKSRLRLFLRKSR